MTPIDLFPTTADVDRIAALPDPVIRNLQITQCYHELAAAMAARVSGANWCTFATWASQQAGQTIRKEDFARLLENAVRSAPVRAQAAPDVVASAQALGSQQNAAEVQETVWDVINPLAAVDRASDAVGRGNNKVFEEIGREFARFYAACLNDAAFDSENIARFCAELRPGDPPDGQQYLRQAFARYYQAFFESDRDHARAVAAAGQHRDRVSRADALAAGNCRGHECRLDRSQRIPPALDQGALSAEQPGWCGCACSC